MKKIILVGVFLLSAVSQVWARVFTPSTEPFFSDLDGAWEFAEAVKKTDEPSDIELISFYSLAKTIKLNGADLPNYLVRNVFEWQFVVDSEQPVWLEVDYQPWSNETEAGFDEPYLVVYLGHELIFKENILAACSISERVDGVCDWRTKRLYLGRLSGEQTITLYAGETGDLQKPSGITLRSLTALIEQKSITAASPTPTETQIGGTSATVVGQQDSQGLSDQIVESNPGDSGQVLGASDEVVEQPNEQPAWKEQLKQIVFQPWFLVVSWLVFFGLFLVLSNNRKEEKNEKNNHWLAFGRSAELEPHQHHPRPTARY
jgi:hypothetical protein